GDALQLQLQPALLARLALLGQARRPIGGRGEVAVAAAAPTAPSNCDALAGPGEVAQQLAVGADEGAQGHFDRQVRALLPRLLGAGAVATPLGLEVPTILELAKRRHARISAEPNIAAATAVAAVR